MMRYVKPAKGDVTIMDFARVLKPAALAGAVCLAVVGCGTLAPGADKVIVTRDAQQVAACKPVGTVSSDANALAGDWNGAGWYRLRNQAFTLGADHVLLTNSRLTPDEGVAYRCHS